MEESMPGMKHIKHVGVMLLLIAEAAVDQGCSMHVANTNSSGSSGTYITPSTSTTPPSNASPAGTSAAGATTGGATTAGTTTAGNTSTGAASAPAATSSAPTSTG